MVAKINMTTSIHIDQMRVIATLSVVVLHVASDGLYIYDKSISSTWFAAHVFDSLVRFAVPLFIMISGALFIQRKDEIYSFIQIRLKRILRPFVLWWSVYFTLNILYVLKNTGISGVNYIFLQEQLFHGSSYHLWYVYMIIGVYLLISITSKYIQQLPISSINGWLFGWVGLLIFITYIPYFDYYFSLPFLLLKLIGYFGYAVLGYVLYYRLDKLESAHQLLLGKIAYILGSLSTFLLTYYFSRYHQLFDSTYYNYLTLNVCLQAIGSFLWMKNTRVNWGKFTLYKNIIISESYGIYLSHVLVIWLLSKLHIEIFTYNAWIMIPVLSFLTVVGSVQLLKLMRKIPIINKFKA
jgi:surface polysaccharide O-acyltransferase-like enzyme